MITWTINQIGNGSGLKSVATRERPAEWDPDVLGGDGVHPGAVGHTRMAQAIDISKIS